LVLGHGNRRKALTSLLIVSWNPLEWKKCKDI
jgi:hypothetical protein